MSLVESRIPAGFAHLDEAEALPGLTIVDLSLVAGAIEPSRVAVQLHGVLQRELSKTDMTGTAMSSRHGATWT
ncbi:hypothetical protein [Paracoccus sp. MC1862]|uniref:hypothetical protein n=1 Tax=Paracoccus sp. MC1862 TaxID=2760307 RepID=UPI001602B871|nr:hypothetical protein [Paracoccus sp. MC1862]MBB1498940.1 hypothetical protein [Paracoccus sp. MC1862]QQO46736.1 hypothetical protein JGR78_17275 [Paracoccus sp. MC1862]